MSTERTPLNSLPQPATPDFSIWDCRSIELENIAAVARDHMANERTFLAWLRASLLFITIGIGIAQLFRLDTSSDPQHRQQSIVAQGKFLGASFIILGIWTLGFGLFRYFYVQQMLTIGLFPATRKGMLILVTVVGILVSYASAVIMKTVQG